MTAQVTWFGIVPLAIVAIGLMLFWWRDRSARRRYRHEVKRFTCPIHHRKVTAELVHDNVTGQVIGVSACDAFVNPEIVACSRDCVALFVKRPRTAPVTA